METCGGVIKMVIFKNRINIKIVCLAMSVILFLSLFGCNKSKTDKSEYPVTVAGVTVKKSPEKVLALSDSLADIVLALDLETKLVARTDETTQAKLSPLPTVGSQSNINVDSIVEYSPDLILVDKELNQETLSRLENANIPIILLNPANSVSTFKSLYIDIGTILKGNKSGKALGEKISSSILLTIDNISRLIPDSGVKPTACYFYDSNKKIATGDTFVSNLIDFSGATNIAKGLLDLKIDTQILKMSDPTYIFCAQGVKESLLEDNTISSLSAVFNNNVYEMDKYLMTRQGHSVVDAVTYMAGKMYPELESSKKGNKSKNVNPKQSEQSIDANISSDTNKDDSSTDKKNKTLIYGESSDEVLKLEKRLDDLDFMPTKPDGVFDDYTKRAITDFQFINNLLTTGEADEKTLDLIFSDEAIPRGEPSREK